ncbi:ROK family protein [Microbacterium istanbulense]|uniref:ROK family protein n=1 Tax=Microbacterium istanbulense TaxID=3122049 RepID=A0ABU8LH73_9MICO
MTPTAPDLGTGRASLGPVLDFAWGRTAFTASDAMTAASLTRSTTIDAIDTLVGIDVLHELPNARDAGEYRAGRPARRFELPRDLGAVIAMDAGDTHLSVALADLHGTELVRRRSDLDPEHSVGQRRRAILDELEAALAASGVAHDDVLALCAGVAAPVARDGSSPPHPENFWERTNPGLVDLLAGWAPVVQVKNDAQLAATAEGSIGAAIGCRDYIALLAGERLGAGAVVDGHLLHGAHGGVGEMFVFDSVRGVDSVFGLGPVTVTEAEKLRDAGDLDPASALLALPEPFEARDVLALAAAGDPDGQRVANAVGRRLGRAIAVLSNMFDPERVIICGAIADGIEPVLESARRTARGILHLPAPDLVRSELGADIVLTGAISTALQSAREIALPRLAEERLRRRAGR